MTELSFLIELLLEHKLPKETKDAIKERIKFLESMAPRAQLQSPRPIRAPLGQSPSTQRILDEMAADGQALPMIPIGSMPDAQMNPAQVAQTPMTQMALAKRQEAIAIAFSGKEEKGRLSPRKF